MFELFELRFVGRIRSGQGRSWLWLVSFRASWNVRDRQAEVPFQFSSSHSIPSHPIPFRSGVVNDISSSDERIAEAPR